MPVLTRITQRIAIAATAAIGLTISPYQAMALTANEVLTNMESGERFSYVSGIVDGLAYARWLAERPNEEGMQCIYGWYYSNDDSVRARILTWLERHPDKPVDALMYVLIKKECGE